MSGSRGARPRALRSRNDDRRDRASLSQVQIRAQNDRSFFIFVDTNQRRGGAFALSITAGRLPHSNGHHERTPDDAERASDERSDEDARTSVNRPSTDQRHAELILAHRLVMGRSQLLTQMPSSGPRPCPLNVILASVLFPTFYMLRDSHLVSSWPWRPSRARAF